jgi:nitroreductase / dihydropteridine reductase
MVSGFSQSKDEAAALAWSARQAYIAHGFALAACAELEIDSCAMEGADFDAVSKIL